LGDTYLTLIFDLEAILVLFSILTVMASRRHQTIDGLRGHMV